MRLTFLLALPAIALLGTAPAAAQTAPARGHADPVRIQNQDNRQYRGEPKRNVAKRNTRCRIVQQKGQDKRVCNQPTNSVRPRTTAK